MNLQLGIIGLGTMGGNLARNAARQGANVAVFNRTRERTNAFMEAHRKEGKFAACHTLGQLKKALKPPCAILLMVKAGDAIDEMIADLLPLLEKGDILIDGGNSHFLHTMRRQKELSEKGIHLIGMGISGGEEGALLGPSMMPGGSREAWDTVEPLLASMAADDREGGKCVTYLGPAGSGHFVKMVHNGIEYALMQLLAEVCDFLRSHGMGNEEMGMVFGEWNAGDLESFLVEITAVIMTKKDPESGQFLLDLIKESAGQKGTGKWTTETAMDLGVAIPAITAAVDARIVSSDGERRGKLQALLPQELLEPYPESRSPPELARSSYTLSLIAAYAQGFDLLHAAGREYGWDLDLSAIARIWRGGCIIRAAILKTFQDLFGRDASAAEKARQHLLDAFRGEQQLDWRRCIAIATGKGIPVPALSASLAYYDSMRRARLPQNLTQAERDFFGAHGYERVDREGTFHTQWRE